MAEAVVLGQRNLRKAQELFGSRYLEITLPGVKPEAEEDCGCIPVFAETVANSSFKRTRTQPDKTGKTALYTIIIVIMTFSEGDIKSHINLFYSF